jgi:hypothetical protein
MDRIADLTDKIRQYEHRLDLPTLTDIRTKLIAGLADYKREQEVVKRYAVADMLYEDLTQAISILQKRLDEKI